MTFPTASNVILGALVILVVGTLFYALVEANKLDTTNYRECKQRTTDIEWCFEKFQPRKP